MRFAYLKFSSANHMVIMSQNVTVCNKIGFVLVAVSRMAILARKVLAISLFDHSC